MNINIRPISWLQNFETTKIQNTKTVSYNNLSPLKQDTVTFGVGEKSLKNAERMSKQVGMNINAMLEKPFERFSLRLTKTFGKLVADERHPNRPIYAIKTRIKSPESIAEKGGARKCKDIPELTKYVQDLMGGRLVMRDCSQESFQQIIDILEDCVKKGIFNITEVESYFAEPELAYINEKMIKSLVKTCEDKIGPIKVNFTKHQAGYHAVHFTIRMPKDCDNAYAELQLMGVFEDAIKYAQDPAYKFEWGKGLPKKYNIIEKYLEPLISGDEQLVNAYKAYTRQVYIEQRLKEKTPLVGKYEGPDFLTWYYPKEMDYNFLYKEMKACDAAAEKAKLAREKAALTRKKTIAATKAATKDSAKNTTKKTQKPNQ